MFRKPASADGDVGLLYHQWCWHAPHGDYSRQTGDRHLSCLYTFWRRYIASIHRRWFAIARCHWCVGCLVGIACWMRQCVVRSSSLHVSLSLYNWWVLMLLLYSFRIHRWHKHKKNKRCSRPSIRPARAGVKLIRKRQFYRSTVREHACETTAIIRCSRCRHRDGASLV